VEVAGCVSNLLLTIRTTIVYC